MERKLVVLAAATAIGAVAATTVALLSGVSRDSGLPPVQLPKPFSGIRRLHARYVYEAQQEEDQIELVRFISTGGTENYFLSGSVLGS